MGNDASHYANAIYIRININVTRAFKFMVVYANWCSILMHRFGIDEKSQKTYLVLVEGECNKHSLDINFLNYNISSLVRNKNFKLPSNRMKGRSALIDWEMVFETRFNANITTKNTYAPTKD